MRKFISFILLASLVALLALFAGAYWFTRPVTVPESTFVEIGHGSSSSAIADQLTQQGIIRSPYALLLMRALHPHARLQAGEYEFQGTLTPSQVFEKLRFGRVFYEEITIPEGSNMFDIGALLDTTVTLHSADFLAAAKDTSLIKDLDPAAPSLEGYLFPSTYRITRQTTAKDLCRMLTLEFRRQWHELKGNQTDVHRVITLASLVEKETAIPRERPLVAAAFTNRLRLNMPLQCDPTTVYAALLDHRYRGVIYKSDLASTNPYNSYLHTGLPPGPIANPGALAIKAALQPAQSNVLYFVAKGDGSGSHHFSATLAEHQLAVTNYRKRQH